MRALVSPLTELGAPVRPPLDPGAPARPPSKLCVRAGGGTGVETSSRCCVDRSVGPHIHSRKFSAQVQRPDSNQQPDSNLTMASSSDSSLTVALSSGGDLTGSPSSGGSLSGVPSTDDGLAGAPKSADDLT